MPFGAIRLRLLTPYRSGLRPFLISKIKKYSEPKEVETFDEVQALWREYQNKNANFSAARYEGGSIQPLIYASAVEKTASSRLVELEETADFMRDVLVPCSERELPFNLVLKRDALKRAPEFNVGPINKHD